jgi:hypothetical protein
MNHFPQQLRFLHSPITVLSNWRYVLFFFLVSFTLLFFSFTLSVRSITVFALRISTDNLFEKVYFVLSSMIQAIPLNLSSTSIALIIVVSILAGLNTTLVAYYLQKRQAIFRETSLGFFGMLSAILGIGCASCGSVLLTSFIGISASTVVTNVLPFKGIEFNLVAILLLLYSIYLISKKLLPEHLLICEVKR